MPDEVTFLWFNNYMADIPTVDATNSRQCDEFTLHRMLAGSLLVNVIQTADINKVVDQILRKNLSRTKIRLAASSSCRVQACHVML